MRALFITTTMLGLCMATGAAAETWRCKEAGAGARCANEYGDTVRGRSNSMGGSTWSDDHGNSARVRPNSMGGSTITDDHGNTSRARTNSLGQTVITNERGDQTVCRERFGRTVCENR